MSRSTVFQVLKGALAIAVIAYLVYVVDPGALAGAMRGADGRLLLAAALLLPLNIGLEGLEWRLLIRRTDAEMPSLRRLYEAVLCGFSLGIFTPARAGEYAGRAFYLRGDRWALGATVFFQHMADLLVAVAVGAVAAVVYAQAYTPAPRSLWWGVAVFGVGTTVSLGALALAPGTTHRLVRRLLRKPKWQAHAAFLGRLDRPAVVRLLGLAALRYLVYAGQFVLLVRALAPAALDVIALGVALILYAKFLIPPVTFTDLGIREGAAVYFLGALGVSQAAALNASLLLFGLNLLLPALLGVPFLLRLRGRDGGPPPASQPPSSSE